MRDEAVFQQLAALRFPVLDKGYIELRDSMGCDMDIVLDARNSRQGESKGEAEDAKLLRYLFSEEHTEPVEMGDIKVLLCCPALTFWHLARHRNSSFVSSSGRYLKCPNKFYIPQEGEWRLQDRHDKQASSGFLDVASGKVLSDHLEEHCSTSYHLYEKALRFGVCREQARVFLPNFINYQTVVYKTDIHNLCHFLRLRMAYKAQYEIRIYAKTIYHHLLKPLFPLVAEYLQRYRFNHKIDLDFSDVQDPIEL